MEHQRWPIFICGDTIAAPPQTTAGATQNRETKHT